MKAKADVISVTLEKILIKQHNLMQLIWGKILKKLKMLIIKIFQRNNNSYTSEKNANTS